MPVVKRSVRLAVFERDGHKCVVCRKGGEGVELTVDHWTPRAMGGTSRRDNLVTMCIGCNVAKRDMSPDEWVAFVRKNELAEGGATSMIRRVDFTTATLGEFAKRRERKATRAKSKHQHNPWCGCVSWTRKVTGYP